MGREHILWFEVNETGRMHSTPCGSLIRPRAASSDWTPASMRAQWQSRAATRPGGDVYAAWLQVYQGRWQVVFRMLPDDLGGWTRPERVSSVAAGDVRALAIAADGRGQAHVLWQARSNCNGARAISEIFLSTRN